jgi:hypothetical protein
VSDFVKIQLRRDNSQKWNSFDPILQRGELGLNISEKYIKIGDGHNQWSILKDIIKPEDLHPFSLLG